MNAPTTSRLEGETIPQFLRNTAAKFPEREAFRQFDYAENAWISVTWGEFMLDVMRWRRAFHAAGMKPGDRVAMLLTNCIEAVTFDDAALWDSLVPVPLHAIDTPGSSAYILNDSGSRILVTSSRARWNAIKDAAESFPALEEVVLINDLADDYVNGVHVMGVEAWLARGNGIPDEELPPEPAPDSLAGFIYTSGTTGRPKGVMLTHRNLVANVRQIHTVISINEEDVYLSFLPFSHTFERTVAHYTALSKGAAMVFARSVSHIESDLVDVKPTLMCTVPRVLERIYQKRQLALSKENEHDQYIAAWAAEAGWRRFCRENGLPVEESERAHLDDTVLPTLDEDVGAKVRAAFGGRFKAILAGGACLNYTVAKFFCAMGLPIRQVYGLTETSPVISISTSAMNHPETVGWPLGTTEVKLGDNDELMIRGPQVMKGYWKREADTARVLTPDGWFHTGDQADLSDGGRIRIKGRIKEIIVTSTGEKIAPVDLEFAIQEDPLFEQVFVCGENRPFITALTVVSPDHWKNLCAEMELDPESPATLTNRAMMRLVLKRVRAAAKDFPSYGIPRSIAILREPFTVESGLLTPTMKPKRPKFLEHFHDLIESIYAGHPGA
ncbi:long-chain fatty acid--CoA ligase [Sutterella sp.]|uniref:AMP-dependent synthetase/ligase n=1 Tax=Sutterella sp. TaxID=1981025 RepID=UPI0026DF1297|nr:long-chain fatty acid--CoA ligase [Sutterella sp.]MDO5531114.1 long-chain fatty acid--CoA ligase [Sutterella sp.]